MFNDCDIYAKIEKIKTMNNLDPTLAIFLVSIFVFLPIALLIIFKK